MNPTNITREEAQRRSQNVATRAYRVHLDLSGRDVKDPETFISSSTVTFSTNGEPTWIDLIADEVLAAELDGQPLDPSSFADHRFAFEAEAGEHELHLTAVCRYSHTGEGLHRFVDPADDKVYLYTQLEIADARRVYANFEQPDLKATFALSVTAPDHWVVISNAPAVEPSPVADGFGLWAFEPTPPISTYITAVVAGDFHVVRDTIPGVEGEVPASVLCRQSVKDALDAERIFTTTKRGFEVFEPAFGTPYAFGTYDQAFVPEFNAGAMENAGCVTIRDEYLFRSRVTSASYEQRDNTILHELAHMWFGDLVTMKWWDDLWLNESFAEWASHFAQVRMVEQYGGVDPWVSFAGARKGWAYTADQLPSTHPIAADMVDLETVEQNFDGITYAKGASALKLLVSFVGEEAFLAGVRAYFEAHAFGNTELTDLLTALEQASGKDLGWFTGEWLETAGVNTLRADFDVDEAGTFTSFTVRQSATEQYPTLRTHRLAIGLFDVVDDQLVRVDEVELDIRGEATEVPQLVGKKRPALVLLNDHDLTYAKVRLDEQSLTTAVEHIDALTDDLSRAVVWAAAWDMCRDAELPAGDYIALVLRGLRTESDLTAVGTLLRQANTAATSYTRPELRDRNRDTLVSGIAALLKDAEPGSDRQLALANALVAAVHTEAGAKLIAGWLEGEEVPEQLVVDTDMRWKIVTSLARMGAIGEDRIEAESQRDQTIQGAEFAAGARSALKDARTKEQAWARACEDPSVPNGTHRQIVAQFWQFDQAEVLQGYAEKYLGLAGVIGRGEQGWPERGYAIMQGTLNWLFPIDADQAYLDRVDAWLGEDQGSEQVRRIVGERRDAAARALRCQAIS